MKTVFRFVCMILCVLLLASCGGTADTDNTATTVITTTSHTTQTVSATVTEQATVTVSATTEYITEYETVAPATEVQYNKRTRSSKLDTATGDMRNITSAELLSDINAGLNIGNSLDACGAGYLSSPDASETVWGNPKITKELIKAIKNAGFKAVRLPVTWREHIGQPETYQIDSEWMDRVQEVVDMILDNGLYCILNTHHEQNWLNTGNDIVKTQTEFIAVWKQIANRFKNYDDYLLFEGFNEILKAESDWSTASATDIQNTNILAQQFVTTVRATGGNNAKRHLIVSTYGAGTGYDVVQGFKLPRDTVKDRLIVEVHTYSPGDFSGVGGGTSVSEWNEMAYGTLLESTLKIVNDKFEPLGVPVIIGEFGAINKDNTSERVEYVSAMKKYADNYNMVCFWWDNGQDFKLFNRSTATEAFPQIIDALVKY